MKQFFEIEWTEGRLTQEFVGALIRQFGPSYGPIIVREVTEGYRMFGELKNIAEEQPRFDDCEWLLIVNKDKTGFNKAAYVMFNEGMSEDEGYSWRSPDDEDYELEDWPFWMRFDESSSSLR